jgi:hypothetical protein
MRLGNPVKLSDKGRFLGGINVGLQVGTVVQHSCGINGNWYLVRFLGPLGIQKLPEEDLQLATEEEFLIAWVHES